MACNQCMINHVHFLLNIAEKSSLNFCFLKCHGVQIQVFASKWQWFLWWTCKSSKMTSCWRTCSWCRTNEWMSVEASSKDVLAHHRKDTTGFSDLVEYLLMLAPYLMHLKIWLIMWMRMYPGAHPRRYRACEDLLTHLAPHKGFLLKVGVLNKCQSHTTFQIHKLLGPFGDKSNCHSSRQLLNEKVMFVYLRQDLARWPRLVL